MTLQIINAGAIGPTSFDFVETSGVRVSSFDPGFPTVREVVDEQPDRNGMADYTELIGSRNVSLELKIIPLLSDPPLTRRQITDNLFAFANPAYRGYLYWSDDDGDPSRRILCRGMGANGVITAPHYTDAQIQFSCPDGVWESSDLNTGDGATSCVNAGNIRCYPVFTLSGTGELVLYHAQSDKSIVVDHVAGGDLIIDTKNMFVGTTSLTPLYEEVDWGLSSWLFMEPGDNDFTITGGTLEVAWRDAWI